MPSKNSITIKADLKKVLHDLKKFGDDANDDIHIVTVDNATDIMLNAKRNAPIDLGKLKQSIQTRKIDDFNYRIEATEKYAPFQEFGTGKFVDLSYLVNAGYPKSYAMQFKGKGIKKVNILPQPFLIPAFINGRKQYLNDLKKLLKDLTKKF